MDGWFDGRFSMCSVGGKKRYGMVFNTVQRFLVSVL